MVLALKVEGVVPGEAWERLFDVALDQHGFITRNDATRLGIEPQYLTVLKGRGGLEHSGYGVYRFPQIPVTEYTPYMEAVLWVGTVAALSHDAVLALHGLAFANPSILRITTPRRVRRTLPPPSPLKIIRRTLPADRLTRYFNIPSTTVAQALIDSRELIMGSRLTEAARIARTQGLLLAEELDTVLATLERTDA